MKSVYIEPSGLMYSFSQNYSKIDFDAFEEAIELVHNHISSCILRELEK